MDSSYNKQKELYYFKGEVKTLVYYTQVWYQCTKDIKEARDFDSENKNILLWDSMLKEMRNVSVTFEEFDDDIDEIPLGYQGIKYNLIFDVKMR